MSTDDTSTPSQNFDGFADILGVMPMQPPHRGSTGYRQTVRLINELNKTTAILAAMPADERRSAAYDKVRTLLGASFGRPRFKIPNQPENPDDLGTIFIVCLKGIFRALANARRPNGVWQFEIDAEQLAAAEQLLHDVRSAPNVAPDIRIKAIAALAELMTVANFGVSAVVGISAAA
jgi:hypothetical protein